MARAEPLLASEEKSLAARSALSRKPLAKATTDPGEEKSTFWKKKGKPKGKTRFSKTDKPGPKEGKGKKDIGKKKGKNPKRKK